MKGASPSEASREPLGLWLTAQQCHDGEGKSWAIVTAGMAPAKNVFAVRGVDGLGAYYRRIFARMDRAQAVSAAAHKLARLIYAMLIKGEAYTDQGQDYFEERYRQRVLHNLAQRAKTQGMQFVLNENPI